MYYHVVGLDLEDLDLDSDLFASFILKGNKRSKKRNKTMFLFLVISGVT